MVVSCINFLFFLSLKLEAKMASSTMYRFTEEKKHFRIYSPPKLSKKLTNINNNKKKNNNNICLNCNRCYNRFYCHQYSLVLFELDRKIFYQLTKNVVDWKIRFQGQKKELVIKPVFIYYNEDCQIKILILFYVFCF